MSIRTFCLGMAVSAALLAAVLAGFLLFLRG
jgi:hypothetical protein